MFQNTVRRWLYRQRHAGRLARFLNAAQARLAAAGVGPNWLVMMEVTGRRTGRTISFPAVITDYDNNRYLVSMLGEDTSWVRPADAPPPSARAFLGRLLHRHRRLRFRPDSARAVVIFGNLTSYPVEHLAAAVLRVDPPHPRPAGPPG